MSVLELVIKLVQSIVQNKIEKTMFLWFGHVERIEEMRLPKEVY
jgi:hypothetical protein